jgi:hypothetical protein
MPEPKSQMKEAAYDRFCLYPSEVRRLFGSAIDGHCVDAAGWTGDIFIHDGDDSKFFAKRLAARAKQSRR